MSKDSLKKLKNESVVKSIFDFTERLSPMLVKELRQGLRSAGFTALFLTMQAVCLLVLLLLAVFNPSEPSSISISIFYIFGIVVCGLQPVRGINAISGEVKGDTIDLIVLTKLTAWKIVFGKWVSIMGQSLIVMVSLLPYLILRYFLGGMQMIEEMTIFALILLTGAFASAIAVGLSALTSTMLRYIVGLGLSLGLGALFFAFLDDVVIDSFLRNRGYFTKEDFYWGSMIYLTVGTYVCWIMLDFGASMIAPLSENRATVRRLSYLIITAIGCAALYFTSTPSREDYQATIHVVMVMLFAPLFITTATENSYLTPRICRTFLTKTWAKPFRYLLYPGWFTGYLFLIPCLILHLVLPLTSPTYAVDSEFSALLAITLTTLVFPLALMSLFGRNAKSLLSFYLITYLGSFLLFLIVTIVASQVDHDAGMLFVWNPPSLYHLLASRVITTTTATTLSILFIVLYSAIIIIKGKPVFAHIKEQEKVAKAGIRNAPPQD